MASPSPDSSGDDIEGLRKQILANAAYIFPHPPSTPDNTIKTETQDQDLDLLGGSPTLPAHPHPAPVSHAQFEVLIRTESHANSGRFVAMLVTGRPGRQASTLAEGLPRANVKESLKSLLGLVAESLAQKGVEWAMGQFSVRKRNNGSVVEDGSGEQG